MPNSTDQDSRMKTFAITFPERYRDERHPAYSTITPDRYFTVEAENIEDASEFATFWFGDAYEAVMAAANAEARHPDGEIGKAVVTPGLLAVVHSL